MPAIPRSPRRPERDHGENQSNKWRRELNPASAQAQPRLRVFIRNHFNSRFRIAHSSRGEQHSGFSLSLINSQGAEPEKSEKNYPTHEGTRPAGNGPTASRSQRHNAKDQSLTLL
jgi:hypothetical protein